MVDQRPLEQMVWHPVSMKLPPYEKLVLLTCTAHADRSHRWVTSGRRISTDKDGENWQTEDYREINKHRNEVLAWMPLPETYRD